MKELSLNILDVAKNSVRAGASLIGIRLVTDSNGILTITISDNGCGMSEETVKSVTDPFFTTRTTRKVGLGLPLLKMAAEQTGGSLSLSSSTEEGKSGTILTAVFDTKSIDCMPMGDIVSTVCILIAGSPDIDFEFSDVSPKREVELKTIALREVLGDVSLAEPEVQQWMTEYLKDQYSEEK
ncbi:MAG: sensor histidine kinase [Ruminococcaceae bacterium]|nr:sensor histidine kinase [Oscillospiraceae bacterium]